MHPHIIHVEMTEKVKLVPRKFDFAATKDIDVVIERILKHNIVHFMGKNYI